MTLCSTGNRLQDDLLTANERVVFAGRGGLGLHGAERRARERAREYREHIGLPPIK